MIKGTTRNQKHCNRKEESKKHVTERKNAFDRVIGSYNTTNTAKKKTSQLKDMTEKISKDINNLC